MGCLGRVAVRLFRDTRADARPNTASPTCFSVRVGGAKGYGAETAAVYTSNWWSVPSGLLPVLFELSAHAGWAIPP